MYRSRERSRNRGMLYILALKVASEFYQLDRKPPVTAGLIAANTLVYLRPGVLDDLLPSLDEVCLHPYLVLKFTPVAIAQGFKEKRETHRAITNSHASQAQFRAKQLQSSRPHLQQRCQKNKDLKRLFLSAFYHLDESHLVYNMLSLLWKGVQLERMMGSTEFASMVAVLLGLSHGIVVVTAKVLATFFDYPYPLTSECAVGFSAVLFALKVVLSSNSPNLTYAYGVVVPARYAAWAELLLIQMYVPGVSFLGHLSGIFAGILYLRFRRFFSGSNPLPPIIRKLTWLIGWPLRFFQGQFIGYRRPTFGHGTVGGRVPGAAGNVNAVWRCTRCTFDNNIYLDTCEMCGTRHGDVDFSASAPRFNPTARAGTSGNLSLEELRRLRLERFNT